MVDIKKTRFIMIILVDVAEKQTKVIIFLTVMIMTIKVSNTP